MRVGSNMNIEWRFDIWIIARRGWTWKLTRTNQIIVVIVFKLMDGNSRNKYLRRRNQTKRRHLICNVWQWTSSRRWGRHQSKRLHHPGDHHHIHQIVQQIVTCNVWQWTSSRRWGRHQSKRLHHPGEHHPIHQIQIIQMYLMIHQIVQHIVTYLTCIRMTYT